MAFSVQMPALGESVTEGTVTRWLKQEGDTVELDEPLVEVSTDKVDTEIPSPAAPPRGPDVPPATVAELRETLADLRAVLDRLEKAIDAAETPGG